MATTNLISSQLVWKVQNENKLLKQKIVILTERCEQYTSAYKYRTSSHKLQTDQHEYQVNELNQKMQSLNQSNTELTIQCNALKSKIKNYSETNKTLSHVQTENKGLQKQLVQSHMKIKTLKQQKNDIKNKLNNLTLTEITTRDQTIENLKIQINKLHQLFEKNKSRRTSSTIRLQVSDSKTYNHARQLSESNSITDTKPRFFVDDSYNISPTPSIYRNNRCSKPRRKYTIEEISDEVNEYKYNKPKFYENNTVHAYYIDGNEINKIPLNSQLSPSDSNNETQALIILDTYNSDGEDFENEQGHLFLHSSDSSGSRSLSLINSQTENVEDVNTMIV